MWWLNVLFVVEAHCGHGPARWRRTIIKLLAAGARQAMSSPRPSRPFATVKGLAKFVVDRRRPWPPPATSSRCHATGRRPVHWRAARLPTALASLHRPTTSRSINLRTGSPMCGRQLQILRPPLLRRLAAGAKARYRHREVGASGGEVHVVGRSVWPKRSRRPARGSRAARAAPTGCLGGSERGAVHGRAQDPCDKSPEPLPCGPVPAAAHPARGPPTREGHVEHASAVGDLALQRLFSDG
jgi:hypothetical protein